MSDRLQGAPQAMQPLMSWRVDLQTVRYIVQVPMDDTRPASPPSRAARMTRRQLAKLEAEELSKSQPLASLPTPAQTPQNETIENAPVVEREEETGAEPEEAVIEVQQLDTIDSEVVEFEEPEASVPEEEIATLGPEAIAKGTESVVAAQTPEVIEPEVEDSSEPEPKTLTNGRSCEEPSTPEPSCTPSRAQSRSVSKSPMLLEASFEAIDALEEALDKVGQAAVPLFDHSADERSPRKARFDSRSTSTSQRHGISSNGARSSSPTSKVSRNPSVIRSLKPPKMPVRTSLSRSASVRTASSKEARRESGEVTDYLASKRRPISMSFPTPPPPLKSSKPPTQSTFQLPGEAVAAKLKAQKEERLRREEMGEVVKNPRPISMPPRPKATKAPTVSNFQLPGEAVAAKLKAQKEERMRREELGEVKAKAISMPPAPKSTKPLTVANFQLPGEVLAAKLKAQKEERLMREEAGEEVKQSRHVSMPPPTKSSKPPTVANFQLPGEVIAAKLRAQKEERLKREEEEEEAAAQRTFKARPAPPRRQVPAQVRQTSASRARESLMAKDAQATCGATDPASKRTSIVTSSTNKRNSAVMSRPTFSMTTSDSSNRKSLLLSQGLSNITPADAAAQRAKAREQFLKDKAENESKRIERLVKEEAAKRAREEAAERGRIASREWAEKQKKKTLSAPKVEESA
ncbi:hypothetical protein K504DRAFT_266570 [Pleomassaria siparia CBS 279.74]|uniref:Uncharacterized protein n=1 Tax=Pleomassaria siparia CBS 279.74 TaxID=1314801 RepID=A0A6G1KCJ0_9PLEO|nr:hypothetical protein K504DRAFT_266570 [Pleomassaria siparia CBS 279.74]